MPICGCVLCCDTASANCPHYARKKNPALRPELMAVAWGMPADGPFQRKCTLREAVTFVESAHARQIRSKRQSALAQSQP